MAKKINIHFTVEVHDYSMSMKDRSYDTIFIGTNKTNAFAAFKESVHEIRSYRKPLTARLLCHIISDSHDEVKVHEEHINT